MGAPEAYVEKYMKKEAEKRGYWCWKLTVPGVAGVPDRMIGGKGQIVFVECKANSKCKPRPLQVARLEQIREAGHIACVIDSRDKVDEFLQYMDGEGEEPAWVRETYK